jgi:hypothetical protein
LSRTGVTFEQAAIEWLRWGEHERGWKRSTLVAPIPTRAARGV